MPPRKKKVHVPTAVPTGAKSLLEQALDAPDDLALRQVYADSLVALGDPLGEYIVTSIRMLTAQPPQYFELAGRAQSLWATHRAGWLEAWGCAGLRIRLHAGLPTELHLGPGDDVAKVFERCPIRTLHFAHKSAKEIETALSGLPTNRLRTLVIQPVAAERGLAGRVFSKFSWANLTELSVCSSPAQMTEDQWLAAFARMPSLRSLDLDASLAWFKDWAGATRLRHIAMNSPPGVKALNAPGMGVESLRIRSFPPDGKQVIPTVTKFELAGLEMWKPGALNAFPNLRELGLPPGTYDDVRIDDLAAAACWPQIESLTFLGVSAALTLLAARALPKCKRLVSLSVKHSRCLPEILQAHPELESLSVESYQSKHAPPCPIDEDALARIAAAVGPSLRRLKLHGGTYTHAGLTKLLENPKLRLEELFITSENLDAQCIRVVQQIPTLKRIEVSYSQALEVLRSEPSTGRYLGPEYCVSQMPWEPIWSHEP